MTVDAVTLATFPKYRREMKGVEWGVLYNTHGKKELDPAALEVEVARLMADDDVTKKKGIYSYVLDGEERSLSIRAFTETQKRGAYERQLGVCPVCGEHFKAAPSASAVCTKRYGRVEALNQPESLLSLLRKIHGD